MYYLKSHEGSVLVYILVFYLFFLSWFHFHLQLFKDQSISNIYLGEIDRNLSIENSAITFLNQSWPDVPKRHIIEDTTIYFECELNKCKVSISGDINYSFIYAIID